MELAGRLKIFPDWYPLPRWDITQAEFENLKAQREIVFRDAAEILRKKYDISGLVSINQFTKVSLEEWFGLGEDEFIKLYGYPDLVYQALALEVENLSRELKNQRAEQELKNKELIANPVSTLGNINSNNAINKVFR